MRIALLALLVGSCIGYHGVALADNSLTSEQLMKATLNSLTDSKQSEPGMAKSISGFRTSTAGANAQVIIDMKADGMNMSSKYLCVPQGQDMTCSLQQ